MAALLSEVRKPPAPWVVRLSTMGLMAYLQNSIGKQLKWLYPTNPQAADKWLEQEIYRWGGGCRWAGAFRFVLEVWLHGGPPNPGFVYILATLQCS